MSTKPAPSALERTASAAPAATTQPVRGSRLQLEHRPDAAGRGGPGPVVLFLGLPAAWESEGHERPVMDLPAAQVALLEAVAAVNPCTVVVLSNGGA